jgi:ArsR family transcriptional regulator, arsenate/arsenite/antimonite-responsive transcriptional repressor / arsenate reductase (thioredoxin)
VDKVSNHPFAPVCSTIVDSVNFELMDLPQRARVHSALGDEARLELVDLLLDGDLSVRELAGALEMPGNLLAHHLNVLDDAGVIERRQSEGDHRRRYVTLRRPVFAELNVAPVPVPMSSVVFVCNHNSARSQYAAAYWTSQTGRVAASAGANPAATVHPLAIRLAKERGLDLSGARPRGYDSVTRVPELLISVCDQAREANLPNAERHIHWSIPDPVAAQKVGSFRSAFDDIEHRVDRWSHD